jgi:TatD DNase family protein
MIDAHCHLEQHELFSRLDELIPRWEKELKNVVSSCAHTSDLDKTLELYKKYHPFIRICIGLHPEFIKDIKDEDVLRVMKFIRMNIAHISAIGEVGLDYHWVKEPELQEKQKELFIRFIQLAKELNLPLVIHSWDATQDSIDILERENMQKHKILFHLLQDKGAVSRIMRNNWYISIGPGIARSKTIKKIARDMPLNRILLETDSPWFKQEDKGQKFGEPINVRVACEKIAEIKHLSIKEVEYHTDENSREFFRL